ncbi:hypothetical protein [Shewanella waksmanii]|uniref:hypothetical protein n=1 Tax=Shewanella waksmanii TaxID=213783 RepID=UPI003734E506
MRALYLLIFLYLFTADIGAANIVLVDSYHHGYGWSAQYREGLKATLGVEHQLKVYELDAKRLPQTELTIAADRHFTAIINAKPDLVILGDDHAIALLSERLMDHHFPLVVLGLNANPRNYNLHTYQDISGLLERPIYRRSVLLASELLPKKQTHKFLVLFDNSATSKMALNEVSLNLKPITIAGHQIEFASTNDYTEWQRLVSTSKDNGYSAVFVGLYHTLMSEEQHIPHQQVAKWAAKSTPAPIFAFWDFAVTDGMSLGGFVLNGYNHGVQAAKLCLMRLTQQQQATKFITDRRGKYYFSRAELERWQITLPSRVEYQSDFFK